MPRFTRSAFRHGLSERDIQRALDAPISVAEVSEGGQVGAGMIGSVFAAAAAVVGIMIALQP